VSKNRMVEYHIARLKDKRASTRLDSIKQLVLLQATEALEVLKEIFENDPDSDVRKAAQKAGREIFVKSQESQQQT